MDMPTEVVNRVMEMAQFHATKLVLAGAVPAADEEDLSQTLVTACVAAYPQYCPALGAVATYFQKIIDNKAIDWLRAQRPPPVLDGNGAYAPAAADEVVASDMREVVCRIVDSLPPEWQSIARDLMAGRSVQSMAKELGIPRTTLGWRIRKYIKPAFRQCGFS